MLEYMAQYQTALKALKNPTNKSAIVGIDVHDDPVTWGETQYWAVTFTLTIEEIF
jgi:hypothetical protein